MLKCDPTTYGHTHLRIMGPHSDVYIGKYCSIAENVIIDAGWGHNLKYISTYPFDIFIQKGEKSVFTKGDVRIGNDVWLGADSIIMSGVAIGNGAVVGARALVTHDVPDYAIVGGVAARILGFRFIPEVVQKLLKIAWWNWDEAKIHANAHLISSPNVDEFIRLHGS